MRTHALLLPACLVFALAALFPAPARLQPRAKPSLPRVVLVGEYNGSN
jgi:hypothetical protein